MKWINKVGMVTCVGFLVPGLTATPQSQTAIVTVDCDKGGTVRSILSSLKPGDVVLVHGTCRENIMIEPELQRITIDGEGKATINAADGQLPAIQVLGREIMIKGFIISGGFFGIAINRGATAVIDNNTIREAAHSGIEVSQNSFARIINNTLEHNQLNGILVLGSSSVHIGVLRTDDKLPSPNIIHNNGENGIWVLRASTARIIGNTLSRNRRSGLTVDQASHADVAGNVFNGNSEYGIRVRGNSGVNLADSVTHLFQKPNTTSVPNGLFGIRCELGAYVDGSIGGLRGRRGIKDVSDKSCIDRSVRSTPPMVCCPK